MHLLSLLVVLPLVLAFPRNKRADAFVDPNTNGGSMLDDASGGSSSADLGEPLNVIISGLSSPSVLTDDGFVNFAKVTLTLTLTADRYNANKAIGFSTECLGLHLGIRFICVHLKTHNLAIGGPQTANLGDGNGYVNQTLELRQDYGDPNLGTCLESLIGGNHLRLYRQNGPQADTGALFLAVSQEENVADGHTISPDGYNKGRDALVASAVGATSFGGVNYQTVSQSLTGLLPAGSAGVNHGIATDGTTILLTVTTG
ncbi:hypothetical protein C8F01DRAFT_1299177 [Mycena amicta]|nr:hypothetical protein C8F01DRAFT_1299177 [Mycena amicta]